jgi:hypothetical protein
MSAAGDPICARCEKPTSVPTIDAGEVFCAWCAAHLPPSRPLEDELDTAASLSHRLPPDTRVIRVDDAATIVTGWSRAVARAERQRIEAGLRQILADDRPTLLDRALQVVHARDTESVAALEAIFGDAS